MARPKGGMNVKYAICPECGEMFAHKASRSGCCRRCTQKSYEARKAEERQVRSCRKHIKSSLERAVDEIAKYNKAHGTNYTYGEYIGKFGVK